MPVPYNFCMERKAYGRDAGLSARMLVTTFLLGLLYVIFAVVLFNVLNVGLVPMVLIVVGLAFFQYFTSDKIALAASGAKVVSAEQAPEAARAILSDVKYWKNASPTTMSTIGTSPTFKTLKRTTAKMT